MKKPKHYICLECGSKSDRSKTLRIGPFGFARCWKCGGRVKENEDWLAMVTEEQRKWAAEVA